MLAPHIISKTRDHIELSDEEIRSFVTGIVDSTIPDYQVSAWLMAAYLNGLTDHETLALTLAMRDSGETVNWGDFTGFRFDKHSTGGVGDKVTLVVLPILAAAGMSILKMSGRGLGHTGGTIDKLEAIPGFRTDIPIRDAVQQVKKIGAAIVGQTAKLVPADKKLYALRDVTATIASIPLIASSIMSKKLAGHPNAILLDVKVGDGAFMKDLDTARVLANKMVQIGTGAGVRTEAALTAMNEPLGWAIGNALEVREACNLLTCNGKAEPVFRDLCVQLAAEALVLAGVCSEVHESVARVEDLILSGSAANKFEEIVSAQGGDPEVVRNTDLLPRAAFIVQVISKREGFVTSIHPAEIGTLAMRMGAGRAITNSSIDPAVGIILHKKVGDAVRVGEILAELHLNSEEEILDQSATLLSAFEFDTSPIKALPSLFEIVR